MYHLNKVIESLMGDQDIAKRMAMYIGEYHSYIYEGAEIGVQPQVLFLVVHDEYSWEERHEMKKAIDDLFSGNDLYGFASGALYFFWDIETKEIFYIGKAINIPSRFAQHNITGGEGTKFNKIEEYLHDTGKRIGYSIFVQSPLEQAPHSNNKQNAFATKNRKGADDFLYKMESRLINEYKRVNNKIPNWNVDEGQISGKGGGECFTPLLEIVNTRNKDSLFLSKGTIRDLSLDPTKECYENIILAQARIVMSGLGLYDTQLNACLEAIDKDTDWTIYDRGGFITYLNSVIV